MKVFLLIILSISSLYSYNCEYIGNISIKALAYSDFTNENNLFGNTKLNCKSEFFDLKTNVEYLFSDQYQQKRYIYIQELYLLKEYKTSKIELGKSIKYWGELEGYNPADIFNQKNYLFDPFDNSKKLGSYNINYTYYFDEDSLESGIKLYEFGKELPEQNNPYHILPLAYNKSLEVEKLKATPSVYLKYNFSYGDEFQSDNKLILYRGYDNKRNFVLIDNSLAQYAYRVNKAIFFSNIVYEGFIFKFEYSYTDMIDESLMSDYSQIAIGFENGFYDVFGFDINTYTEYYKYNYQDESKPINVDISEVYDNDIFVALKFNFNNTLGSELKTGLLYDIKNYEKVFQTKIKTRILDGTTLNVEYLKLVSKEGTLLQKYRDHNRITISLRYTF